MKAIYRGSALSHLSLEFVDGTRSLSVNKRLPFEDSDHRFDQGSVGFGCRSPKEPRLRCPFHNLMSWHHEGGPLWERNFDSNSCNYLDSTAP